jgi:AcrR family transcriptional regulator
MAVESGEKAERILSAAARVLARSGYGGTTVAAVAAEAEVSRGLVHYYFESKDDMVARVLRRNVETTAALLGSLVDAAETPREFAASLTSELRRVASAEPALFTVLAEGLSASRRSARIGRELAELHGLFTSVLESAIRGWSAAGLVPPGSSARGLAVLLTALVDGLGLDLVAVEGLAKEEEVWAAFEAGVGRILTGPVSPPAPR